MTAQDFPHALTRKWVEDYAEHLYLTIALRDLRAAARQPRSDPPPGHRQGGRAARNRRPTRGFGLRPAVASPGRRRICGNTPSATPPASRGCRRRRACPWTSSPPTSAGCRTPGTNTRRQSAICPPISANPQRSWPPEPAPATTVRPNCSVPALHRRRSFRVVASRTASIRARASSAGVHRGCRSAACPFVRTQARTAGGPSPCVMAARTRGSRSAARNCSGGRQSRARRPGPIQNCRSWWLPYRCSRAVQPREAAAHGAASQADPMGPPGDAAVYESMGRRDVPPGFFRVLPIHSGPARRDPIVSSSVLTVVTIVKEPSSSVTAVICWPEGNSTVTVCPPGLSPDSVPVNM